MTPVNDAGIRGVAAALAPSTLYGGPQISPPIPPGFGSGGWEDSTEPDGPQPSCVPASESTYNSLWYSVHVPEPAVMTVAGFDLRP